MPWNLEKNIPWFEYYITLITSPYDINKNYILTLESSDNMFYGKEGSLFYLSNNNNTGLLLYLGSGYEGFYIIIWFRLSVCLSVCMYVCMYVCLYVFHNVHFILTFISLSLHFFCWYIRQDKEVLFYSFFKTLI